MNAFNAFDVNTKKMRLIFLKLILCIYTDFFVSFYTELFIKYLIGIVKICFYNFIFVY